MEEVDSFNKEKPKVQKMLVCEPVPRHVNKCRSIQEFAMVAPESIQHKSKSSG